MLDKVFDFIAWLHGGDKTTQDVCKEWHSFIHGFCEMACLRIPPRFLTTDHAKLEMLEEEHYYQAGRACGFIITLMIITLLIRWVC